EVAAALGISRGRASGRLHYAIALRERLPRVAEVFAQGHIDFRLMAAVVYRTELIEDPELIARLDAAVARHAHPCGIDARHPHVNALGHFRPRQPHPFRRVPG
ncbi:DUF222 domain-containing protein, partial [Mycobacterium paraintracellulare]|uniref:DUF222 domain-containing protein n=1 Tax=Mycobacterium paraintracellulare TaxID=1138383 RepID=UPI001F34B7BD